MVHKTYEQYASPLARVVHGLQASWDPVVATVYDERFDNKAVWSPCNRFIAVVKLGGVEIRDAMTLNLISNFQSPSYTWALSFSPDSRFLTHFYEGTVVTWDIQTGVSVITTSPELPSVRQWNYSPAYSMDGKMLARECCDGKGENFIVTHDFSTSHTYTHRVSEGHAVSPIWTHGEFLRFATVKSGCITIWQTEFTLTPPPEVVESLPAPDELTDEEAIAESLFLPTISRLAIALRNTLLVWDVRDSKRLLKVSPPYRIGMSFSSDGRFFACLLQRGVDGGIRIWKESPAGYIIHRKLTFDDLYGGPLPRLSPNGESIILLGNSMIHLLHTEDPILSTRPTLDMAQDSFILKFFLNDALAAFMRHSKNVVTILDLQSGNPRLEIDTGMEVICLGVAGDTVVVADQEKIVTWKLDTRNTRGNIHDSIRITTFDPPQNHLEDLFYPQSVSSDLSRIVTWSKTCLAIYDVSTGMCLTGPTSAIGAITLVPDSRPLTQMDM